jgi:hypothetical protein
MRFITEFHRNEKLTKGINTTFIALIPKVDSHQRLNDFCHPWWEPLQNYGKGAGKQIENSDW